MRIVFDTASFITAIRSGLGAAFELVGLMLDNQVTSLMDYKLGLEYRAVALRAEHVKASPLSRAEILQLIETLEGVAEAVTIRHKPRPLSSDPNDDMILDLAINGQADAIVTNNVKHFRTAAKRYGIAVVTPGELLEQMRGEFNHAG